MQLFIDRKVLVRSFLCTLFFLLTCLYVRAQPGANDPIFNSSDIGYGFGDGIRIVNSSVIRIKATAVQPNGKIIVGGIFSTYNGVKVTSLVRLNPNGTLDSTFYLGKIELSSGSSVTVEDIRLQADGKIIIAGRFTSFDSLSTNNILRLNSDGTLDTTFSLGSGANNFINAFRIQPDGKIVIVGVFSQVNGINRNRIARLNQNGSLDLSFVVGSGANDIILEMELQADGKIYIGGFFTSYAGITKNRIARIDSTGALDLSFNPGSAADGSVNAIAIQNDGRILIGGSFTTFNTLPVIRLTRLLPNGNVDPTFSAGLGPGGTVSSLLIQPDGKILVGGAFSTYDSFPLLRFIRVLPNGVLDPTFNSPTDIDSGIEKIDTLNNGEILLAGNFRRFEREIKFHIVILDSNGNLDRSFNSGTGLNDVVNATAIQPDGRILVAGNFSSFNGERRIKIARLLPNGSLDTTFNPQLGADFTILTMALQSNGKILVGGSFTTFNGIPRSRIARLNADGSLDLTFDPGLGFQGSSNVAVHSITLQSDGKIIVGGLFTSYNTVPANSIIRLFTDGTPDGTFNLGTGTNGIILALKTQIDNKILVGGLFTTYNGTSRNRLLRLNANGTLDQSFQYTTGANDSVLAITLQPDGKIVVAGAFNIINSSSRNRIARLNTDGTIDGIFNPSIGPSQSINAITMEADGKILIGGSFSSYNGIAANYIARLNTNATLDTTINFGTGTNGPVTSIGIQNTGRIIIGGRFTAYNGTGRNRIARILRFNCTNSSGSTTVTACNSFMLNGVIYTSSGVYVDTIVNTAGCDSTVTLNLTIYYVDASVTQNGATLSANFNGAGYQWLDCNNNYAPIIGETNQVFNPNANGFYAVLVNQSNCLDTSTCYQVSSVGVESSTQEKTILVFPNPVQNQLVIRNTGNQMPISFEVLNSLGQVVFRGNLIDHTVIETNGFAPGVYVIKFDNGKATGNKKIIKL